MKLFRKIIILFTLFNMFGLVLYASLSVSNKSVHTSEHKDLSIEQSSITLTNFTVDKNASYIFVQGQDIVQSSDNIAVFEYIPSDIDKKTNPFRFTEVSFFITFPFIYTYALLAASGFNALEGINQTDRNRNAFRRLQTSELLFTFIGATLAGAATAYGNYSRVYGKKSQQLQVSFSPTVETVGRNTGAGFIFSFSYPYDLF